MYFKCGEFSGHFVLREELLMDLVCAQPSLLAVLKAGIRWTVVRVELISFHHYCGVQRKEEFRMVSPKKE